MGTQYKACSGMARTDQGYTRPCPKAWECVLHKRRDWPMIKKSETYNPGPYDFDDDECGAFEKDE